jgi:hypothetical protein
MQAKRYTATRIRHLGVFVFLLLNCLLVTATTLQSFAPDHFIESSSLPAPLQERGQEESAIAFLCTNTVSTHTSFRVCHCTTHMHGKACSDVEANNNSSYSYAFDSVPRPVYYDFLFRFNLF